ncbi:hypothetical protein H0H81_000945, partial [Sphagnurus paluster]
MSTATAQAPPTYAEAVEKLKTLKLSPEEQISAQQKISDQAGTSQTNDDLLDAVKSLSVRIVKIDRAFETVRLALGEVDNANFKDANGQLAPKLQPEWTVFQKEFTKLLWESRDTATRLEVYAKDFLNVIVPLMKKVKNKADYEKIRVDIEEFVKRKDKASARPDPREAYQQSQGFTDLRRRVENFGKQFDQFADAHIQSLQNEINGLMTAVQNLDTQIARYEREIAELQRVIASRFNACTIIGLAVVALFCPLIAIGLAARAERERVKVELADKNAKLATAIRLRALLKLQISEVNDICENLDNLAYIWALIGHDAAAAAGDLEAAIDSKGSMSVSFTPLALNGQPADEECCIGVENSFGSSPEVLQAARCRAQG